MAKFRKNKKGQYSKKARETALKLYVEDGAKAAAAETGIARQTIASWAKKAGKTDERQKHTSAAIEAAAAEAQKKREQIKVECRLKALEILRRMDIPHTYLAGKDGVKRILDLPQAGDMKDYAVALAVLIDKAELLDGNATDRTEHRTTDQLDREIESLLKGADDKARVPA